MKKKNVMFPVLLFTLVFILSACAKANTKTGDSSDSVFKQIDSLKDYHIVKIEHMTNGIESMKIYSAEYPKPFQAGRFLVTFENGDKLRYIIL